MSFLTRWYNRLTDPFVDLLTEWLYDPEVGKPPVQVQAKPKHSPRMMHLLNGRGVYTKEQMERDRVEFKKSLARTD